MLESGLEERVQSRGRYSSLRLVVNVGRGCENPQYFLPGYKGGENHGAIGQKRKLVADDPDIGVSSNSLHQVPFIDDDDTASLSLADDVSDA